MPDIFISYSSHDRLQALDLAERLRVSGFDPWIDHHNIHGTMRWGKEIVQAINSSKVFAVLISSSSLLSENVMKELNLAAEKHKKLLPVMLEETELTEEFAYHLAGVHRVTIENTGSILKALELLKPGTQTSNTAIRQYSQLETQKDIRLAVLPFDDLSPQHDNEWFADGMLDELITTLGGLEHMKVPSRTDVMYYKKHHPKAQEIASDLNVRYLVGGSVRKAGEKIRITASLTDAFTNQLIWTNHYDGSFDDIFDLQENVSKNITETLKLRLTPQEKKKIEEQPTQNAEAYELCLRANELFHKASRDAYESALELYKNAIELDHQFADAYIQIASTSVAYYREYSRDPKWLERAEQNLRTAEKIIGKTAKTLWVKGEIAWQRQNFEEAEKILLNAAVLDPNSAIIFNMLGNVYLRTGKTSDAVAAFEKALKITPTHVHYFNLLVSLSILKESQRIKEEAKIAIPIFEKHLRYNSSDYFWRVSYAYILHWAGRNEDSAREANLLAKEDLDGMALYNLGGLFDNLGMPDINIELLRRAIQKGFRNIDAFRNDTFDDPKHQAELNEIIMQLEALIEEESKA